MLKPSKSPMGPLLIMGLSIVLVLYVHTSLAPAFPEMVEFFDTDYSVISWVLTAYLVSGFNAIFLVGAICSLLLIAFMAIMRRRAVKMGMPANK
jgi:type II secretory pathway component PulF